MKTDNLKLLLPFVFMALAVMACAQDCMGTTFAVQGYVVDTSSNPIEGAVIRVWSQDSFERPYNMIVRSDAEGYFQTEDVFSYGCISFEVEIVADGYQTQHYTYYPPAGEGFNDELPSEITITLIQEN